MHCSKCGAENPDRAKFCVECASPFVRRCPSCNVENPPAAKFCLECAKPLDNAGKSQPAAASANSLIKVSVETGEASLEGERKTVTALFADIKGSMDLMEDIDPEEARAIVDPALQLMMDAVHHYGGHVAQSTGDGILALFGAPIAHEDHPQRALYAAVRMQEELKRHSDRIRSEGGLPIQVRVGVNTGEVVVRSIQTGEGHVEYTPIGHSISLAARMQALAPIGSIAATEHVRKLCEGYFIFKNLGPTKVKGVSEPVNVYEVTGYGPLRTRLQRAAGRGLTKFVGREREMEALKHAAGLVKEGHGQIVAAVAEPGVGKSRLVHEFKVRNQSGWMVLEALSFSHDKATAYLPLIELLHDYFKIGPDDEPRTRREKVAGKVTLLDRSLEDSLPYLFALLDVNEGGDPFAQMDTQARRRRIQEPIKRLLLRESRNQPLMLVFEDLHWIDEETQAFLNLVAEGIATAPVLMLVNYRPEYSHQWGAKSYYTQLRLDPLGRESADEMLATLLSDGKDLGPLKRLIIEKTEGNPLFMEEVVHALFEEGVLVRNGAVKVAKSLSQLRIPLTVQGILAARIDRLPPDEKELLQMLAVIGTEFPLGLVRHIVPLPPERLEGLLNDLQMGDFIFEQPTSGDIEYTFKHALTHDVAYNSLLTERRRLLHERTAQAIEALYHERLDDHYPDLAHHYRSSHNAAKAVEYLRLAGEQAVDRGTYEQALANVEPALGLLKALPQGPERLRAELGVRLMEGNIVTPLYGLGSDERLQTFQRVCELAEQLDDDSALLRGLLNMPGVYYGRGDIAGGLQMAEKCVGLAERLNSGSLTARFFLALGGELSGDLLQAASIYGELMKSIRSARQEISSVVLHLNLWVITPARSALVQHALGRPDEALQLIREALRRGRQLKHPFTLTYALLNGAMLHCYRREPEAVRELAEAEIAMAQEHGFREPVAIGRALHRWAIAERGDPERVEAEAELEADSGPVAGAYRIGTYRMATFVMSAWAYLRAGRAERALNTLDKALARGERSGLHLDSPEVHRLRAEAILTLDPSAITATEACLRKAIEIARGQSAKWWELRATVSLARLLARTDRRDEARTMLADIYNWFTEGFDTADLMDAKKLFDELA
jgi:class 3 adenylate cyclase/tetratricopeptide (TPR) repeat protein